MAENEKLEQAAQAGSDKVKKDKKADKKAKPSLFTRVGKWLKDMKSELKKVVWPTKSQMVNNTLIVLACVLVVGIFIWIFDYIATNAIELLIALLG